MSKYTPGPWYIDGTVRGTDLIVSNNDYQVAICITHPNPESNKANARLIAAAPELLEALEGLMSHLRAIDETVDFIHQYKDAKAAIKKATGE